MDELEWDNLETRRSKQLAALMYKSINEIAPNYLTQVFDRTLKLENTASIIEGLFSGIVYRMILEVRQI